MTVLWQRERAESAASERRAMREAEPNHEAAMNPFELLIASLQQLAAVLRTATDQQYVQKPVGVIESSIGGHVRHCLDHFEALCVGADAGELDYDQRARGTPIETNRAAALSAIAGLQTRLARIDESGLGRAIAVRAVVTGDGDVFEASSTIGREAVFVLSHTVHHNALIGAMCATLGIPLPERFGYAPATLAHLNGSACARSPSSP